MCVCVWVCVGGAQFWHYYAGLSQVLGRMRERGGWVTVCVQTGEWRKGEELMSSLTAQHEGGWDGERQSDATKRPRGGAGRWLSQVKVLGHFRADGQNSQWMGHRRAQDLYILWCKERRKFHSNPKARSQSTAAVVTRDRTWDCGIIELLPEKILFVALPLLLSAVITRRSPM